MARLYEYQGKELLLEAGFAVPRGGVARTPDEARARAKAVDGPVVLKAQVFVTGRAAAGGIRFADTPDEAATVAAEMLGADVKGQAVAELLVEEKLEIASEMYAGVIVDDAAGQPLLIFAGVGGTGIEEIAAANPDKVVRRHIDVNRGLRPYDGVNAAREAGLTGKTLAKVGRALVHLWETARRCEARAAEINPLVVTGAGEVVAADCRITIDDYAVYRHPELGIEVAREFDRPPTELDLIAYNVEKDDYRGTFYFVQLEQGYSRGDGYVGFHGAGGGGSMMSMDAVLAEGFKLANFCDTSGNPPASKVYRAAKIILAQGPIDGYFGSGSGVASQEQFHSARGLVKAFREAWLDIPAVIRLGGNREDLAVEILTGYTQSLPAPVEGYKKDDPAGFCARRLRELVDAWDYAKTHERLPEEPHDADYSFGTITGGTVSYDYGRCGECDTKVCIETCVPGILELDDDGCPRLNIPLEDAAKGKCTECLACEVECYARGDGGGKIHLPIPGLAEYLKARL
ncbi:MAG: acetate--CoA ligase family protein [Candidatus Coatesbacteria bacterium]|nr:MAG: acetate--CoA ligase family protein [Candidatus Coatesbacteria bacterium]